MRLSRAVNIDSYMFQILVMSKLRFIVLVCVALFTAFSFTACEKENVQDDQVSEVQVPDRFLPGEQYKFNKAQIDAMITEEFGFVESDYALKYQQVNTVVMKKLGISNIEEMTKGYDEAKDPTCGNITFDNPFNTGTAIGRETRGSITCDDTDLNTTVFMFYILETFSDFEGDTEVLEVNVEVRARASVFEGTRETLFFLGATGLVSKQAAGGGSATGIVTRQIAIDETNGAPLSCDPDDFGDGLELEAISELRDFTLNDGEIDRFRIQLRARCKD